VGRRGAAPPPALRHGAHGRERGHGRDGGHGRDQPAELGERALGGDWHSDGAHLSSKTHLAPHCLNVFVPLVDITALNGGTEMQPGTHALGEFDNQELQRERSMVPTLRAGQIVLMDFRTRHRGLGNNSQDDRPLLYFQYSVPGWKDPNFSARRYQRLPKLGKRMSREERMAQRRLKRQQQQQEEEKEDDDDEDDDE